MESIVEGVDIDPAELQQPGWANIRRKQQARASPGGITNGSYAAATSTEDKPQRKRRKQGPSKPPITPLPDSDIKIVLRPRGGLALVSVSIATLADLITKFAGLNANDQDQVRIHPRANFIVVSTPDEDRAKKYTSISYLELNGQQYPVATHVSAPANTALGVIFDVPSTDTAEQIVHSLTHYNPDLGILDARRLNTSNIVQILFDGTRVPFWVRYRAATYRCKPFKRKTEACTKCWRPGHRQDVCPTTQAPPRCALCGLPNPTDNHPCVPKCIVCEGAHNTGSPECPRRFQPQRKPLTYAQATINAALSSAGSLLGKRHNSTPPFHNLGEPGKHSVQKTKQDQEQRPVNQTAKVSSPCFSSNCSLQTPTSSPIPIVPDSFLRELQTIRRELSQLRQENEKLRQENKALKQATHQSSEPSPTLASQPSSPPPKRRAIQTAVPSDEGPEPTEDRLVAVERACQSALAEQKAEYIHLHQTLLTNQATMQATIESIRAELHKTIADLATALGVSVAPQAIPQPMFDLTHDPNQSQ